MPKYINHIFFLLLIASSTVINAAAVPAGIDKHIVRVQLYQNDKVKVSITGTVVSDAIVLTTADIIDDGGRLTVIDVQQAELKASVLYVDKKQNIALLQVVGLVQPSITFSKKPVEAGRLVRAIGHQISINGDITLESYEGSIFTTNYEAKTDLKQIMITHNAAIKRHAFGGALLNNCDQLVAVNMSEPKDPSFFSNKSIKDPVGKVFALNIKSIEPVLTSKDINYSVADTICLSAEDQAKLGIEEANKKAAEEIEKAKVNAEKEAALVKVAADKKIANEIKKSAADKLKAENLANEREEALKKQLDDEKNLSELEKKALEEEMTALEQKKQKALEEQAETERQQIVEREKQKQVLIGVAVGVVLLVFIVIYLLRRRKQAQLAAEQQAQQAQQQANEVQSEINAQAARKQRLQQLRDVLLEGVTPSGEVITLKIKGASIGESDKGVVVGRNPNKSEYILNYEEISREQFRLIYIKEQLMIEDLKTTNGTILNGETLTPYQPEVIMAGAIISMGELNITVTLV